MSSMCSAVGTDPENVVAEAAPEKLLKLLLKTDADLLTESSSCSRRCHQSSCCCLCSCHSSSMLVNEAEVAAGLPDELVNVICTCCCFRCGRCIQSPSQCYCPSCF